MNQISVLFFLFVLSIQTAHAQLKVNVQLLPMPNFVHQLDCVSGALNQCSKNNYEKLWQEKFLKNEEDKKLVQQWSIIRGYYDNEAEIGPKSENRRYDIWLDEKFRIAGYQAKSIEDYLQRLDLIIHLKDRSEIEKILRHFYPRFETWWKKEVQKKSVQFVKGTEKLLASSEVKKKIQQFFHFYEARLPQDYSLLFNLFYRPDLIDEPTKGQQIKNYSVTEFLSSEKPQERMDVVLHELCHFFYAVGREGRMEQFQKSFHELNSPKALSAFNLLNETLATTFGNGMINRLLMTPKRWEKYSAAKNSFYNDEFIDMGAKALLPWLTEWIESSKTLYHPDFVPLYVSQIEKALGEQLLTPRTLLTEMIFVGDKRYENPFASHVRNLIRSKSTWISEGSLEDPRSFESYNEEKNRSALLIIHPENIKELEKKAGFSASDIKLAREALLRQKNILFGFKRGGNAVGYLVSAESYQEALKLVEILANSKKHFEGLYTETKP